MASSAYLITRDKFMAEDEARRLLKVMEEKAVVDSVKGRTTWITRHMLVHLALNSGLRVSEIASLTIGDLKLTGKDHYLTVIGKGSKKRDVYLDQGLVKHLRDYIDTKKRVWGEPVSPDAPLLAGRGGNHYTTTALQMSFKKALEAAGLPGTYSIHACRHTYATLLLEKTNNIRFVQKQLGHANIAMTALYADIFPEKNRELANKITA